MEFLKIIYGLLFIEIKEKSEGLVSTIDEIPEIAEYEEDTEYLPEGMLEMKIRGKWRIEGRRWRNEGRRMKNQRKRK